MKLFFGIVMIAVILYALAHISANFVATYGGRVTEYELASGAHRLQAQRTLICDEDGGCPSTFPPAAKPANGGTWQTQLTSTGVVVWASRPLIGSACAGLGHHLVASAYYYIVATPTGVHAMLQPPTVSQV